VNDIDEKSKGGKGREKISAQNTNGGLPWRTA
jgi:hypothetical protein